MADTIFIIDDDSSVRRSLSLFLGAEGYAVEAFGSAEEYLATAPSEVPGCIILDVNLEGKSGLELQEELISRHSHLPIIFITGHGTIPMSVDTLKKGAVNFLEKPFDKDKLLNSISEAIQLCRTVIAERLEVQRARILVGLLTPRETEILHCLHTGKLNKQIAGDLDIAEQTVKLHRRSICDKLGVKSVPELLRIADKAGLTMT